MIESIDIGTAVQPEKLLDRLGVVVQKLNTPAGTPVVKPTPQSSPPPSTPASLVLHLAARSYKGTWNEFPVEDWIVLDRKEARRLLPRGGVTAGESWELDKEITSEFLTKFLPNGFGYASYHKTRVAEQSLKATVVSVEKGVAHARVKGTLTLKQKSINFNVSPRADIDETALMQLEGFIDFEPSTEHLLTIRLLADKATARNGQVEYSVGLGSLP